MMKIRVFLMTILCLFLSTNGFNRNLLTKFSSTSPSRKTLQIYSTLENDLPQKLKKLIGISLASFIFASSPFTPTPVQAGWFGPSPVEKQINDLCTCQKQVTILHQQLQPGLVRNSIGVEIPTQLLRGGPEDSAFLQTTLETKLKPCQNTMQTLAPQLTELDEESKKKITNLPLLMKGHLLELQQAIDSQKVSEQEKEVAEVEETLNDYLNVVNTKYPVNFYEGKAKPYISDKDYYGPLGCEFWGKVHIDGSKNCITPEEAAARANAPPAEAVDPLQKFGKINTPLIQPRPPSSSEANVVPTASSE